jgi:hypothetical protein
MILAVDLASPGVDYAHCVEKRELVQCVLDSDPDGEQQDAAAPSSPKPARLERAVHAALHLAWTVAAARAWRHVAGEEAEGSALAAQHSAAREARQASADGDDEEEAKALIAAQEAGLAAVTTLCAERPRGAPGRCCGAGAGGSLEDVASLCLPFLRQSCLLLQALGVLPGAGDDDAPLPFARICASRPTLASYFSLLRRLRLPAAHLVVAETEKGGEERAGVLGRTFVRGWMQALDGEEAEPCFVIGHRAMPAYEPPSLITLPTDYAKLWQLTGTSSEFPVHLSVSLIHVQHTTHTQSHRRHTHTHTHTHTHAHTRTHTHTRSGIRKEQVSAVQH